MAGSNSLRERKKAATRQAILTYAHERFHSLGFDAVTVEEICEAVEVSKRTFFRYFPSKEALVFPNRERHLGDFQKVLDSADADESPFDTLRRATRVSSVDYTANARQILAQQELIEGSPALQACEREIDGDWEAAMAAFLERQAGDSGSALRARVLAGAAIGVVRATMRHWYAVGGCEDLCELGLEAIDCLERGFPLTEG